MAGSVQLDVIYQPAPNLFCFPSVVIRQSIFQRYKINFYFSNKVEQIFSLENIDPSLKEEEVEEDISLDLTVDRFDQTKVQQVFERVRTVFEDELKGGVRTKYILGQTLGQGQELVFLLGQISLGSAG